MVILPRWLASEGHVLHLVLQVDWFSIGRRWNAAKQTRHLRKGRLTYPRTGFVRYPRHKARVWRRLLATIIGGMMAFIIISIVLSHMDIDR